MFINEAFAQTAAATPQGGVIEFLTPLVVVVAIFYMLVWRPQGKRMKAHEEMVQSLKVGDKVITTGGIQATVAKTIDDTAVVLTIARDTDVTFSRHSVTALLDQSTAEAKEDVYKKPVKKIAKKSAKKSTKKPKKAA